MNNTLIAIDLLIAAMNTSMRLSQMLQTAQAENRDITDEEITALRAENDALENQILGR
jgi:hypothetical protein